MTKGANHTEAENYANTDIQKIEVWAKNNKIEFNDTKSKVLLITRRRKFHNKQVKIYLNYKIIPQVAEIKYLGIHLNTKFNFGNHIQQITQKSLQLINMLGRTARLQWGLGSQALKTIYTGALVPMLTYGAPVWEEALQSRKNIQKLQKIQRLINIKISKAHRTLSYEASCVVAGNKPICITIAETAKIYKATHDEREDNLTKYDAPLPLATWPHPAERIKIEQVNYNIQYTTEIYTDGSKYDGKVGAAAVIYQQGSIVHKIKNRLHEDCSNNQAEQIAILSSLQFLNSQLLQTEDKKVAIFTDSQVTLARLRNISNHDNIIEQIRENIKRLNVKKWSIHFGWVKAHIGIEGNEMADSTAKEAAADESLEVTYRKKPKCTIVSELKEEGLIQWEADWANTTKGAVCKKFFPSVRQRMKLRITMSPQLTAIITGHGITRSYLHRFRITDDPTCSCQEDSQTVDHLIYTCPKLERNRHNLKMDIIRKGDRWPVTHEQLVSKYYTAFRNFIKAIDFSKV